MNEIGKCPNERCPCFVAFATDYCETACTEAFEHSVPAGLAQLVVCERTESAEDFEDEIGDWLDGLDMKAVEQALLNNQTRGDAGAIVKAKDDADLWETLIGLSSDLERVANEVDAMQRAKANQDHPPGSGPLKV